MVASSAAAVLAAGWFDEPRAGHTFLSRRPNGSPYRWDPCEPIHYAVNTAGAPAGALDDVHEAVRRLAAATGIEFVDDGLTTRTAQQQDAAGFQEDDRSAFLPVLISWEQGDDFAAISDPSSIAVGIPVSDDGEHDWVYRSGAIVVNAAYPIVTGFGHRDALGPTLMHEWAHVLGLGHVASGDELMWSPDVPDADLVPTFLQSDWGEGDLAGLREVGRPAGCVAN
jgi:hypothetical protein